ncbi:hypothetical protein CYMTET_4174 [Cymbomonas tetramitiformis]|uniref:Uncharacterized protein n=1 Tax=Cymbomonas tetramitiformis TaxID=36881 RepID=A0AAE0LKN4_9CHLO|nr:hypothetical protein CYMTET_4174 [Cymbomonas tetramitiformis]
MPFDVVPSWTGLCVRGQTGTYYDLPYETLDTDSSTLTLSTSDWILAFDYILYLFDIFYVDLAYWLTIELSSIG